MAALMKASERRFAESVVRLAYCNPFLPERIAYERDALGDDFDASMPDWNLHGDVRADHPNVRMLLQRSEQLVEVLRRKLKRPNPPHKDLQLYQDLVLFVLYYRYREAFEKVIESAPTKRGASALGPCFSRFERAMRYFLLAPHFAPPGSSEAAHLFACFFQVKRAFHYIFRHIIGTSHPAARFRAAAWQSIFTHDLRRYRSVLYNKMGDITTLITGPSGTGKELAARAVAMAQYIPFDLRSGKFTANFDRALHPVNLSALSPTLIESELFGHVRGAFTGAVKGRPGRFEFPRPLLDRPGCDFSFSGLKTAVMYAVRDTDLDDQVRADIALAFQTAVVETLIAKCLRAVEQTAIPRLVVAGGVGANRELRTRLARSIEEQGGEVYFPRPEFCTDNGAMIAYAGALRLRHDISEEQTIAARARWSLADLRAPQDPAVAR